MVDNPRMLQCKTSVSTSPAPRAWRRHRGFVVIASTALFALMGCGQKGPLTLPSTAPAASAPAAK
ncbi:MAG: lipoprotein [Piscinibacter sp.]|uniref:LPS translocon maturation chaperone LptM n=1 Tax=Piscinibacter sp. TaxID=1903157 RepID=UPI003D0F1F04